MLNSSFAVHTFLFAATDGCQWRSWASGLMISDWDQLLDPRPSLVFTAWQHTHTFSYPRREEHTITSSPPPPPPPPLTPPSPALHPRLLLHMNNAEELLHRRYQHAVACFIHTRVRQISPSPPAADPCAARPPASKTLTSRRLPVPVSLT